MLNRHIRWYPMKQVRQKLPLVISKKRRKPWLDSNKELIELINCQLTVSGAKIPIWHSSLSTSDGDSYYFAAKVLNVSYEWQKELGDESNKLTELFSLFMLSFPKHRVKRFKSDFWRQRKVCGSILTTLFPSAWFPTSWIWKPLIYFFPRIVFTRWHRMNITSGSFIIFSTICALLCSLPGGFRTFTR